MSSELPFEQLLLLPLPSLSSNVHVCHIHSLWSDNKNLKFINADYPISFSVKPRTQNTCKAILSTLPTLHIYPPLTPITFCLLPFHPVSAAADIRSIVTQHCFTLGHNHFHELAINSSDQVNWCCT